MNRHRQILAVLVVVLLLALLYAWFRTPRQQTVTSQGTAVTQRSPAQQRPAVAAASPSMATHPLAYPEPEQREVVVKRNLFTPLQVVEARQAAKQATAVKLPPPPPATPQQVAQGELNQYKLLGLLKKQGKLTVFLTRNGQIRLVRVGDPLIAGYQITNITDDRLLMRSAEGDELSLGLR